jgi:acyl carrier protein
MGFDPFEVPDSFDFFLSGVIDSFGILEMVGSIEDEFRVQLDMATLDAEQITILGPLSQYVAENAKPSLMQASGDDRAPHHGFADAGH